MGFTIALVQRSDFEEICQVDEAAMVDNGIQQVIKKSLPPDVTHKTFFTDWIGSLLKSDPQTFWKLTDDESGRIAAFAIYTFIYDGSVEDEKTTIEPPLEGIGRVMHDLWSDLAAFQRKEIAGKPHALLRLIATHPDFRRQGAGGMLLDKGDAAADEAGMITYLQAHEIARSIYEKHGYVVMSTHKTDLAKYDVPIVEVRSCMKRLPRSGKS